MEANPFEHYAKRNSGSQGEFRCRVCNHLLYLSISTARTKSVLRPTVTPAKRSHNGKSGFQISQVVFMLFFEPFKYLRFGNGAESEAKRPPIPTEGGQRFRSKAATQSERKAATLLIG
jgi:hypothetical protein